MTFLKNHASEIVALDFFSVPTMKVRILCVLVLISIEGRKIIFFNVTEHPNSEWSIQQLRNAFYDEPTPRFLIGDRDKKFGKAFTKSTRSFGIHPILTAHRCPWQNGFAERVIGSIRRECLDHLIIFNESRLHRVLTRYFHYYNTQRTHLSLEKDSPVSRKIQAVGKIESMSVANGLHHYYYRKAA